MIAMAILSISLTQDCCDHLMHMRSKPFLWKLLLLLQIIISMTICLLNALLTASLKSTVDILMNAVGLLVLNDLDNIIGAIYLFVTDLSQEDEVEGLNQSDKIYAMGFVIPHLTWVILYSLVCLRVISMDHPPTMFWFLNYMQVFAIPFMLFLWYFVCFSSHLKKYRETGCLKFLF